MSDLKPMSAAEYRAHAKKATPDRPTEIVQLKSGSVFELRRPDLEAYMIMGRLPQSLVNVGVKAWKSGAEQVAKQMTDEEVQDALVFMREIVHDCTVNPKFVELATSEVEISATDMLKRDFDEIFEWAMSYLGVAGMAGLLSFRGGQKRGVTTDSANGAELGDEAESAPQPAESIQ